MSQHIHSFRLKDTLLFRDFEFVVPKGLSAIYGLNRTNGGKSMQANGAGKSSAFASISEILYEEPIVGLKKDTVTKGEREVVLNLRGKKVEVRRKNTKLQIKVGGKVKEFRTKAGGREWLKKHLPQSVSEFNTYSYLDARVPHPLVMGKSAERKHFFTAAFNLDNIDVERRIFEAELSKLKRVRAAYDELRQVFDADRERALPKEKRMALERQVKDYEAELADLDDKNQRLQVIAQVLAFEASAPKQIAAFAELCPNLPEFSSIVGEVERNLKDNKKKLKEARDWEDYQRDSRKYAKAFDALSDDAKKLVTKRGLNGALKRSRKFADMVDGLETTLEESQRYIDEAVKKPKAPKDGTPSTAYQDLKEELRSLEHQIEHAEKFGTGKCGTCGQDVKIKSPKKLKARMAEVEADMQAWEDFEAYELELQAYEKWRKTVKSLEAELPVIEAEIKKAKRMRKVYKELNALPEAPEKFEGRKLEVEVCERMVDEDRKQLELLEFMQPNLENVELLRKLTDTQRAASSKAPKLRARINEIHEKLSRLKAKLEVNESVVSGLRKMKARLLEMREELKDEESLKLLVEAYADKNMKRNVIKSISTRLMAEVNKYAKLIFPEDYEFSFQWTSSELQLLVTRKYQIGKKTKVLTSDVRKLSGAESKLFTFILVLALLTFVPARKRSNVLILDEPDANFGAETTESFKKLLPILNQVIPSIIIITPKTEVRYEGAQEFTVLKQKGEARLVKGHPTSIK